MVFGEIYACIISVINKLHEFRRAKAAGITAPSATMR
jgi:hypothetical protein